jgi:hypothetical protein
MEIIFLLVVLGLGAAAFFHFKRKNSSADTSEFFDSSKKEDTEFSVKEVKVEPAPKQAAPKQAAPKQAVQPEVAKKTVKKSAAKTKTAAGARAAKKPKMHVAK